MNRLPSGDKLRYRFVAPRPSPFWVGLMKPVRRRLLRKEHRVVEWKFEELDRLRTLLADGSRVLLAPNHTDHGDGLAVFELAEACRAQFCYMATHQIFEGPLGLRYHLFPRCGIFPVDREGAAVAALKAARNVLVELKRPLLVFPEGEIYHTMDRITPLREGVAAMAMTSQKAIGDETPVHIVPVAMKYRHLDPREAAARLSEQLTRLERRFTWRPAPGTDLTERLYRFAEGLLALKEVETLGSSSSRPVPERVATLRDTLLERLEERFLGEHGSATLPERVNLVHRRLLDVLKDEETGEEERAECSRALDDLFLVVQLFSYPGDYVRECPTVERVAETLIKFEQDLAEGGYVTPVSERRLTFRVGEPIDMRTFQGEKSRVAIRRCTAELEQRLQQALDEIGPGTFLNTLT